MTAPRDHEGAPLQLRELDAASIEQEIAAEQPAVEAFERAMEDAKRISRRVMDFVAGEPSPVDWEAIAREMIAQLDRVGVLWVDDDEPPSWAVVLESGEREADSLEDAVRRIIAAHDHEREESEVSRDLAEHVSRLTTENAALRSEREQIVTALTGGGPDYPMTVEDVDTATVVRLIGDMHVSVMRGGDDYLRVKALTTENADLRATVERLASEHQSLTSGVRLALRLDDRTVRKEDGSPHTSRGEVIEWAPCADRACPHLWCQVGYVVDDLAELRATVERLRTELDDQQFHHAACLSIAEGAPDWETFDAKYPAARAVRELRRKWLAAVRAGENVGILLFRAYELRELAASNPHIRDDLVRCASAINGVANALPSTGIVEGYASPASAEEVAELEAEIAAAPVPTKPVDTAHNPWLD